MTKIQSGMRGHLWRRTVRSEAEHELVFINMKPQVGRGQGQGAKAGFTAEARPGRGRRRAACLLVVLMAGSRPCPPPCPQPPLPPERDPQSREHANRLLRKRVQYEHLQRYDDSVVPLKRQVEEMEGQDMRDVIQDKVGPLSAPLRPGCRGCGRAGQPRSKPPARCQAAARHCCR